VCSLNIIIICFDVLTNYCRGAPADESTSTTFLFLTSHLGCDQASALAEGGNTFCEEMICHALLRSANDEALLLVPGLLLRVASPSWPESGSFQSAAYTKATFGLTHGLFIKCRYKCLLESGCVAKL
jgi:hypothetical protein